MHKSRQTITYATRGEFADNEGDKIISLKLRGKVRHRIRQWAFLIYSYSFLEFELYIGDSATGHRTTMTGYEAMQRNKDYRDRFYQSLNDNGETKSKLMCWMMTPSPKEMWEKINKQAAIEVT